MTATARISLDAAAAIGPVSRRLFGGFVEHLGRHIYSGIYEPGHPTAGADGFRRDVVDLVRELGVTSIRYPGGNFVSGFAWEDGVGPAAQRPRRLNLAWHSTETNEVGLHEFQTWLDLVGSELMLAVNLGTRGVAEALELVEYANVPAGTTRAEQRRDHGRPEPFGVRMWCLGNEMDGPWQLGHRSAEDYGKLAAMTAKAMRQIDPDLELVVCGSSGSGMPTFGAWERTVLEHTYEDVDLISCHAYYEPQDGDLAGFLASGIDMAGFIETVAAIADEVGSRLGSAKRIDISFDEWNVWYMSRHEASGKIAGIDNWPAAPRLLEDSYTVADAVAVGGLLIALLNHADRVSSASLAQLVNVIAPIMTEPGGPAWRQTTFHPFALTSRLAQGTALRLGLESPSVATARFGEVPVLDAAATVTDGRATVFVVNRGLEDALDVTLDASSLGAVRGVEARGIWDEDIQARNTLDHQDRVRVRTNPTASRDRGAVRLELPPASWTAITLEIQEGPGLSEPGALR